MRVNDSYCVMFCLYVLQCTYEFPGMWLPISFTNDILANSSCVGAIYRAVEVGFDGYCKGFCPQD